ncbi:lysR substrate binding domain protein [Clostridioides difficile CD160]|nr:lysR substrate binding domain protein [Clostridioides difficile CD160]
MLREKGSAIRDTLDSVLSLSSQKAYPVWESVSSFALIKAAEAGLGITILPENLLSDSLLHNKLRLVKLDGIDMENKMLAILHKDKNITQPLKIILDNITNIL